MEIAVKVLVLITVSGHYSTTTFTHACNDL